MQNEIVINATPGETRMAILEKNQLVDLHIARAGTESVVSHVIKGRVTRVLPGMQAAFVDIGLEKAAFLYAGDYVEDIESLEEGEGGGGRGRGRRRGSGRRTPPDISSLLEEGREILVQVAKEPIGTKGARITSHVSIAGRHLVLTPWNRRVGVSRRIESDRERRRLREIVDRVRPKDLGFIIRTAGEGTREADLEADVRYLTKVWDEIQIRKDQVSAPAVLYSEPPLPLRALRDFTGADTKRLVIDDESMFERMKAFMDDFLADPKPRLELYRGPLPIFDHFGIEPRISENLGRKVWLKSGGYLIIDQSEALTAIDVNTGSYVGKSDLEETVLRTNLEAVREVVYQLRFRNIGGLIIIDLIDMESSENREKVYRALQEAVRGDKARTNVLKISELGLVEMTRKRTRENLVQTLCEPCSYCDGRGYLLSSESVGFQVLREIRKDLPRFAGRKIEVSVHRRVAEQLLTTGKASLQELERELGREIEIRARADVHQEQFELRALDGGEPVDLDIAWLAEAPAAPVAEPPAPTAGSEAKEPPAQVPATAGHTPPPGEPSDFPAVAAENDSEDEEDVAAERTTRAGAARALAAPGDASLPSQPVDAEGKSPILPDPDEHPSDVGEES